MRPSSRYDGLWPKVILARRQAEAKVLAQTLSCQSHADTLFPAGRHYLWKRPPEAVGKANAVNNADVNQKFEKR